MTELVREIQVTASQGLHLRPLARLVALASGFRSVIGIAAGAGELVDAKSLISLASLAAGPGSRLRLVVRGEDAHDCMQALLDFLSGNLDD